jgi:flagellar motor switch protein FliN
MNYFACWTRVAAELFSQALAGEPELNEAETHPFPAGSLSFSAYISGDVEGRLTVLLDAAILSTPLVGEGIDQKTGWAELLRETFDAAAGDLLTKTGKKCRVENVFDAELDGAPPTGADPADASTKNFVLRLADHAFHLAVQDQTQETIQQSATHPASTPRTDTASAQAAAPSFPEAAPIPAPAAPGFELLSDVELEASLRFGSREMPLGEILELGPGDVVPLDRNVADPVDLIVGDKIVARGEVVLVNGNFGLRVTEVASPRKRLESIRCLF